MIHTPQKAFCRAQFDVVKMSAVVPFEYAVYAISAQQVILPPYAAADRFQHGIAGLLFPYSQTQIHRISLRSVP